jgi:hypothetical protein
MRPSMVPDTESRARATIQQDGLFDAFLGFAMLVAAAFIYLDHFYGLRFVGIGGLLPLASIFGIRELRKRYTFPRVGHAGLKAGSTQTRAMALVAVAVMSGTLMFLTIELAGIPIPQAAVRHLPLPIVLGVTFWLVVAGLRTGFARFFLYAGLGSVALAASYATGLETALVFIVPMALTGALMTAVGIAVLVRFVRVHPEQSWDSVYDS